MKKISDRVVLGVVAGLGGEAVKVGIGSLAKAVGLMTTDTTEKAAGMFISRRQGRGRTGHVVGYLADAVVAAALGVGFTYMLSTSGKDNAALKGAFAGELLWVALYGGLSRFGVTNKHPVHPNSAIAAALSHAAFGATTACIAASLGDPELFSGKRALIASQLSH